MPTPPSTPEPGAAEGEPTVTVATVVLNAADDLAITLESIVGQDCRGVERLVLDGMSWDGTHEVLARYRDDLDRVETIEDAGIFSAMNEAARRARGDFILFMNAGDRFHRADSLRRLVERKPAGADIVVGDHVYLSGGFEEFRPARDFGVQVERLRSGDVDGRWLARFPAHQATLTRTAVLRQLGYDPCLRVCADHDFLLRAAWAGAEIAYVDETVAVYADGGFSARNGALLRLELNAVYRSFSDQPDRVDRLLYDGTSPFGGQRSPFSGGYVSGISPPRAETPGLAVGGAHRLLHAGGARFLAPSHAGATGLRLAGFNGDEAQDLRFSAGGELVGTTAVPAGPFMVATRFTRTLPAGTIVDVLPQRTSTTVDGTAIALAFHELTFDVERRGAPLPLHTMFRTRTGMDGAVGSILAGGWWFPEAEHVWSAGRAGLALGCSARVSAIRLTVHGNPVLDGQRLAVEVNGRQVADAMLSGTPAVVEAAVSDAWRQAGAPNAVGLVPSASCRVGADPRELGFALIAVELV